MDLTSLTIVEASELIHTGQVSPVELTQAYLERVERYDPLLNCFITFTPELALQQAQEIERTLLRRSGRTNRSASPLLGIPIALKDLYETRGLPTTAGCTFFKDYLPTEDAQVVKILQKDGVIFLGKLNMHEIALGVTNVNPHFGTCRNPWNPTRITGGSSGGSAAALAAELCMGSLGTDSGGSIRIPASLCGVVGLKPTYGRVSLRGVLPLSWNTDHAGPMARCVQDVAIMLQRIAGYDAADPYSVKASHANYLTHLKEGVKGWRIAFAVGDYFDQTDLEVLQAVQSAAQVYQDHGAIIEQVQFPGMLQAAQSNLIMVTSDAAAYHAERLAHQPEGFGDDILRRLRSGAAYSSGEYIQARRTQTLLRRQFERFFEHYDVLLMPSTPVSAPPIEGPDALEQARLLTRYTAPFNLTGLPALSLPCGYSTRKMPVGLQLVARPWAEASLLRAAFTYEQATNWHSRKPALEKA